MKLIETGIHSVAIAELAGALTDLRAGGGAAARTDETRLREVTHMCSYISTIYCVANLKLVGQALPAKIRLFSLVSPFMNFDTNAKLTDIIMFNSRNLGALIVDERPHVKEWDEPQFGIQNVGIEESYGFGVLNEGQAIAVAKRVVVRANEFNPGARAVVDVGSDDVVLEMLIKLVGGSPISVSADRFGRLLIPSASRRARLPSSETAAAPDPQHGSEAPAGRGFSSLPAPVLEPGHLSQASFTADRQLRESARSPLGLPRSQICCRRTAAGLSWI